MPAVHLLDPIHKDALDCVHAVHQATDGATAEHEDMVGRLSALLARHMGCSDTEADAIGQAARLHDIGKVVIPPAILHKRGPLTDAEQEIMQRHPEAGSRILLTSKSPLMTLAAQIALAHHENMDGSGYPHGLRGSAIAGPARIVALCDVYDALRRERPYKAGLSHEDAVRILSEGDDRLSPEMFDEAALAALVSNSGDFREAYAKPVGE